MTDTITINEVKYLKFTYEGCGFYLGESIASVAEVDYNGIVIKAKINSGFLYRTVNLDILIPEDKAIEFSKHTFKK